jgi:hypothetical protein
MEIEPRLLGHSGRSLGAIPTGDGMLWSHLLEIEPRFLSRPACSLDAVPTADGGVRSSREGIGENRSIRDGQGA